MSKVNEAMEDLEDETRFILVDGEPVSIKSVVDSILNQDTEKKRKIADG